MKKRVLGFLLAGLAVFAMAGGAWAAEDITVTFGATEGKIIAPTVDTDSTSGVLATTVQELKIKDIDATLVDGKKVTGTSILAADGEAAPTCLDTEVTVQLLSGKASVTVTKGSDTSASTNWAAGANLDDIWGGTPGHWVKKWNSTNTNAVLEPGAYYLDIKTAAQSGNTETHFYIKLTVEAAPIMADAVDVTIDGGEPAANSEAEALLTVSKENKTITLPATLTEADATPVTAWPDKLTDELAADNAKTYGVLNYDAPIEINATADAVVKFKTETGRRFLKVGSDKSVAEVTDKSGELFFVEVPTGKKGGTPEADLFVYVAVKVNAYNAGGSDSGIFASFDVAVSSDVDSAKNVTVTKSSLGSNSVKMDSFSAVKSSDIGGATAAQSTTFTASSTATAIKFNVTSIDVGGMKAVVKKASASSWADATITSAITDFASGDVYRFAAVASSDAYFVVEVKIAKSTSGSSDGDGDSSSDSSTATGSAAANADTKIQNIVKGLAKYAGKTILTMPEKPALSATEVAAFVNTNSADLKALGETIATVLPPVSLDKGLYVIKVTLNTSSLTIGQILHFYQNKMTDSSGAIEIAVDTSEDTDATLLDSAGTVLTNNAVNSTVKSDGVVNVAFETASAGDYQPYMTISAAEESSSTTSPKSGNSGCDMGLTGGLAVLLAALLPLRGKRG